MVRILARFSDSVALPIFFGGWALTPYSAKLGVPWNYFHNRSVLLVFLECYPGPKYSNSHNPSFGGQLWE
jgi:hypothetical protein